jgi:hypothetical protein
VCFNQQTEFLLFFLNFIKKRTTTPTTTVKKVKFIRLFFQKQQILEHHEQDMDNVFPIISIVMKEELHVNVIE